MGCVSANEDSNTTSSDSGESNVICDNITIKYTDSIPVTVNSSDYGYMDVEIDDERVFHHLIYPYPYNSFDIPSYRISQNGEVYTPIGLHNITFKFEFKDKNNSYTPQCFIKNGEFNINFIKTNETSTLTMNLNVIEKLDPIVENFNLDEINITHHNYIPFNIDLKEKGKLNVYVDSMLIEESDVDENEYPDKIFSYYRNWIYIPGYEEYIDVGRHNLTFEFEFKNKDRMLKVTYSNQTKRYELQKDSTDYPYDYIFRFNCILNVIPKETIILTSNIGEINVSYGNPINFKSSKNLNNLKVFADGELIFSGFHPYWYLITSIPLKINSTYLPIGKHNITFEIEMNDEYDGYSLKKGNGTSSFILEFVKNQTAEKISDYRYILNGTLIIKEKNPIEINATNTTHQLNITHADNINFTYNGSSCNILVYVDGNIIFKDYGWDFTSFSFETYDVQSLYEPGPDIGTGYHELKFEFYFDNVDYLIKPMVSKVNSTFAFDFNECTYLIGEYSFLYEFKTELNVLKKNPTIHIVNLNGREYVEGFDVTVKLDNSKNNITLEEYWENEYYYYTYDMKFQNIGIIISNEKGIVYMEDNTLYPDKNGTDILFFYETLDTGRYNLTVINFEDNTNDTAMFEIYKSNLTISEIHDFEYGALTVDFYIDYFVNSTITVTLENETKKIKANDIMGNYFVTFKNVKPGKKTLKIYQPGNNNFNSLLYTEKFTIEKEDPYIYVYDSIKDDTFNLEITSEIKDTNQLLTISVDSDVKKIKTTSDKPVNVSFNNLKSGIYKVSFYFPGDDYYLPYEMQYYFEIISDIIENTTSETEKENATSELISESEDNETYPSLNIGNEVLDYNTVDNNVLSNENMKNKFDREITENSYDNTIESENNVLSSNAGEESLPKSYEISKSIYKSDSNFSVFVIICFIIFIASLAIYLKGENDYDDY